MSIEIKDELLDIEGIKKSNKNMLDLFIRRTAVITSTPEFITEKIIKDQWRNANMHLGTTKDTSEVDFCNIGTFFISKRKGNNKINTLKKGINTLENQILTATEKEKEKHEFHAQRMQGTINQIKRKLKLD